MGRIGRCIAVRADPVLAATEFARRGALAAHALHQALMQFAQQAQRQRQSAQAVDAVVERDEAIADFVHVVGRRVWRLPRFVRQQVGQIGARAFDADSTASRRT